MDLRGSLRGFGDCSVIPRGSLGRRVIQRIYCADWRDIVKVWFFMYLVCGISWLGEPWEGRVDCEEILTPCIGYGKSFCE